MILRRESTWLRPRVLIAVSDLERRDPACAQQELLDIDSVLIFVG
jgi:hypothetical protein